MFERRDDGFPLLSEHDESTIVPACFSAAPRFAMTITCSALSSSIGKRFAVVAKAIATSLGLPAEELEEYREWGMYLDDLVLLWSGVRMLTGHDDRAVVSGAGRSRLAKARSIEWLGQTAASVCWIGSMLSSGIRSSGDWLQLFAASAWLLANIAAIVNAGADSRHG